jgi:hypothetical protein
MFVYDEYMQSVPISLLLANVTVCFRTCVCVNMTWMNWYIGGIVENILIFLYVILQMKVVHQLFL